MGISANTVSKALNGKPKISEELREKVIETARIMGYEKNINASRLSQKPIKIGVLINGFDENYYRYTEKGLKAAADFLADRKVSVDVRVIKASKDNTKAFSILNSFLDDGCNGVIINDLFVQELSPILEKYQKSGIKYAFLNGDYKESARSFAMVNDYCCAAGLAAEMLCLTVDSNRSLAVYSHLVEGSPQNDLVHEFCQKAKELGRQDIQIKESADALFEAEDLGGIYVSHASYLEVCKLIKEKYPREQRPKLVVSDLYKDSIPYIEDGTITALIYQEPEEQAFSSVVKLYEMISEEKPCEDILTIKPLLIMKSNYKKYL